MEVVVKSVDELYIDDSKFDEITILHCENLNLLELKKFPKSLKELYCSNNSISILKDLPKTLEVLSCSHNQIKLLEIPENLKILDCSYNNLEVLNLNNKLEELYCHNNNLKNLGTPDIPKSVKILWCHNNNLVALFIHKRAFNIWFDVDMVTIYSTSTIKRERPFINGVSTRRIPFNKCIKCRNCGSMIFNEIVKEWFKISNECPKCGCVITS